MADSGHSGHRQRMRSRAAKYGIESLEDHEFLELLLFNVIPRQNTNPIAHSLIERFGSLGGVFEASYDELIEAGLNKRAAFWIAHMADFSELYRSYYVRENVDRKVIKKRIETFVKETCKKAEPRLIYVISINYRGSIVHICHIHEERDFKENVRFVCEAAAKNKAYYVVLAQTYDVRVSSPTEFDCCMTSRYYSALAKIGIVLLDRYHVTRFSWCSYRTAGAFFTSVDDFYGSLYYKALQDD